MKTRINSLLFLLLLSFTIGSCSKKVYHVEKQTSEYYKLKKNKFEDVDKSVETTISPYRIKMKEEMDEIIAYTEVELVKAKPNSTMGNWIADIVLDETKKITDLEIHAAFQNYGGLRIGSIAKGNITRGKIFEVMPFENLAVILHLPGSTLRQLCDRIVAYGGWPTSKGISFKMGRGRKAENILIGGIPLEENKIYNIVLADYVANGGDSCDFLKDSKRTETGVLIRDLIIDNLKSLQENNIKINTQYEERILLNDAD